MYVEGAGVIPSVTNVNNTSILTESLPEDHGITGNYFYDRASRAGTFMESEEFLLRPTIFDKAKAQGLRPASLLRKRS